MPMGFCGINYGCFVLSLILVTILRLELTANNYFFEKSISSTEGMRLHIFQNKYLYCHWFP